MLDAKVLGENIRKERKRQLLTIEQLAEMAGITDNFLGKVERGDSMPSLPTMDNIACALNVSIDFLKGSFEYNSEYQFIHSLMEVNGLTPENREKFIDFISTNIRYFKQKTVLGNNKQLQKSKSHARTKSRLKKFLFPYTRPLHLFPLRRSEGLDTLPPPGQNS